MGNNVTFKAGDLVRCVDTGGHPHLTRGATYKVESVGCSGRFVRVTDDMGFIADMYPSRFALVPPRVEKAPEPAAPPADAEVVTVRKADLDLTLRALAVIAASDGRLTNRAIAQAGDALVSLTKALGEPVAVECMSSVILAAKLGAFLDLLARDKAA